MEKEEEVQIDQNRLSRQLGVFGIETQRKLMKMRVFIHGITGLGVQVAKNLIMMSPKSVTLYDPAIVTMADVGRNFYCSENHIEKVSRANACLQKLQELNLKCKVETTENNGLQFITQNFDCVIIIDNYNKKYLIELNEQCRIKKIGFIATGCLGLYGYIFNDFGQSHTIEDPTGQEPQNISIQKIIQGQNTIIQCQDSSRHGFQVGDIVEFKTAKGMTEINGMRFQVKDTDLMSFFQIGDTRNFSSYIAEGTAKKIIMPVKLSFKSFQQSLEDFQQAFKFNNIIINHLEDPRSRNIHLHFSLNKIYEFYKKHNRLPLLLNIQDSQQIVNNTKAKYDSFRANKIIQDFKQFDQEIVKNIALYAETQISPVSSFFGGIVAQEVVKLTGKFTPINQWLHYEFFNLLPNENNGQIQKILMSKGNRYKDYIALFGDQFFKKCQQLKILLAGAGSLSCEHLKNLLMMGVSSGQHGKITIADDKYTKNHNLNSNFLLTEKDVNQEKVKSVAKNAKQINQDVIIKHFAYKLSNQTEEIYNDDFWTELDLIIGAIDKNKDYIDDKCVWYEKPLFHSAVQGLKGNSLVILPFKTSTLTDISETNEVNFDYRTLINFPYKTQHLICWASNHLFAKLFKETSELLNQFYQSPINFIMKIEKDTTRQILNQNSNNTIIQGFQKLSKFYLTKQQKSYQKCIQFMIEEFQLWFIDRMNQTIMNFDLKKSQNVEKPFWTGLKRKPQPLVFDINDPLTLEFIYAGANIYANMMAIPIEKDLKVVSEVSQRVYQRMQKNRQRQQPISETAYQTYLRLIQQVKHFTVNKEQKPDIVHLNLQNENNWQLQYIHAATNLRARVYRIEPADRLKIRFIAGQVIPKVVTTAAMTAGLTSIEIIKYLLKKDMAVHKNSYINLAFPRFLFSQPSPPIINRGNQFDPIFLDPTVAMPGQFTKWDKIDIKKHMLVIEMIKYFEIKYNLKISGVIYGNQMVYSEWMTFKNKKRLTMSVQNAISEAVRSRVYRYKNILKIQLCAQTLECIDCVMPPIRYFICTGKY